jgi:hypothetical protein
VRDIFNGLGYGTQKLSNGGMDSIFRMIGNLQRIRTVNFLLTYFATNKDRIPGLSTPPALRADAVKEAHMAKHRDRETAKRMVEV